MGSSEEHQFAAIEDTFKRSIAILRDAEIPFLLGGSLATWAYGGPETRNDLDFMVKREDSERALEALVDGGMKPEHPPEDWLVKAWDGEVLVDLIHHPRGMEITDEVIERGQVRSVAAMDVRVMAIEDVLTSKLLALGEHSLDLEPSLQLARAVREQVDWDEIRARTEDSPYARAFLHLAVELGLCEGETARAPTNGHGKVRVVP